MSIVKYLSDGQYPNDGDVVYCDNGAYSPDRAIYKNGEFVGGGDFPTPPYKMSRVSKWFDLNKYGEIKRSEGERAYFISFDDAEKMN